MYERLDPDFYAAVRRQAELGGAVGPKGIGAAYSGMDSKIVEVLGQLTTRLEKNRRSRPRTNFSGLVVAADDGTDAFAAAAVEHGAPSVLAGSASGGVLAKLHGLTSQVQAMEEKVVGVHLAYTSLLEDDAYGHCGPKGALSAGGAVARGHATAGVSGGARGYR
ncbi:hypothetical protein CYMTET_30091 [Cymbomonas tetramitiformis]|uniref:Uncharacterized protein n=1 Tax=Cymbomonas tetramitiformis TaxID=36881 RepID=A0AAE0KUA3_9CHLO|nr:hypothetical protein CYMTET_30091 [Cymbomonas tetramitiformis]